ncbi:MAG: hypothetical protein AAGG02_17830 [Cyanobacteria bacterium P01_H01_bin.15]
MDNRQRRIQEHLARSSSSLNFERLPQNYQSQATLPDNDRIRRQDHLKRSTGGNSAYTAAETPEQRKQRIMNHVRVSNQA